MFYKEVIADKHHETNHLLIKYSIINFSNNRKNFLRINAEMTPDFVIKHEEIIFSDGLAVKLREPQYIMIMPYIKDIKNG